MAIDVFGRFSEFRAAVEGADRPDLDRPISERLMQDLPDLRRIVAFAEKSFDDSGGALVDSAPLIDSGTVADDVLGRAPPDEEAYNALGRFLATAMAELAARAAASVVVPYRDELEQLIAENRALRDDLVAARGDLAAERAKLEGAQDTLAAKDAHIAALEDQLDRATRPLINVGDILSNVRVFSASADGNTLEATGLRLQFQGLGQAFSDLWSTLKDADLSSSARRVLSVLAVRLREHLGGVRGYAHKAFGVSLPEPPMPTPSTPPRLTPRERECLLWSARGKSIWVIGQILGISEDTVKHHLTQAMAKLGTTNRVVAINTAMRAGLIDP